MGRYILRRIFLLVPVVLGVTFLTFALIRLVPGDIVTNMMGVTAANNEELRAQILKELGLDKPLLQQYIWWIGRIIVGDFGFSFVAVFLFNFVDVFSDDVEQEFFFGQE